MSRNLEGRTLQSHRDQWARLCARYLSVAPEKSIWRYSRRRNRLDPDQGWKLHVSATVLRANWVLKTIGPFLESCGILFKGPASLEELNRLNSGIYYGYTQVGKFLTIYPRTTSEALALAEQLHDMTAGASAPAVPFDLKFKPGSCIHYRYGAFQHREIENGDGSRSFAIRSLNGKFVPDRRNSPAAKPHWVVDPFLTCSSLDNAQLADSPLKTTFRVFSALAQRGKGGVYLAIDLSARRPYLCVLKEGRKHGEPDLKGRDGHWRARNERRALHALRALGVEVPRVHSSFEVEGNFYLVTEFVPGISLQSLLNKRSRRLSILRVLQYGIEIAGLLSQIHSAGWLWRDCKPSNLIVTRNGILRALDFETACPINRPHGTTWGTPAFAPPEYDGKLPRRSGAPVDLYALGVTLYHLFTGKFPSTVSSVPVQKLRRHVPLRAQQIVTGLLDLSPSRRPSAHVVSKEFRALLASSSPKA